MRLKQEAQLPQKHRASTLCQWKTYRLIQNGTMSFKKSLQGHCYWYQSIRHVISYLLVFHCTVSEILALISSEISSGHVTLNTPDTTEF